MTISAIKEKLHSFIDTAKEKQLAELYLFIADKFAEKYDWWEDEDFIAEIDRRIKDFESGKTKGVSWEEVKLKARLRLAADKDRKMDLMKQAGSDPLFLADMKELD